MGLEEALRSTYLPKSVPSPRSKLDNGNKGFSNTKLKKGQNGGEYTYNIA